MAEIFPNKLLFSERMELIERNPNLDQSFGPKTKIFGSG